MFYCCRGKLNCIAGHCRTCGPLVQKRKQASRMFYCCRGKLNCITGHCRTCGPLVQKRKQAGRMLYWCRGKLNCIAGHCRTCSLLVQSGNKRAACSTQAGSSSTTIWQHALRRRTLITEPFFRRNLPHWQPVGGTFFITYRLAGTLPGSVLSELNRENQRLRSLPRQPGYSENEWNLRIEKKTFAVWDEYLDRDKSMRWLSDPRISRIVQDNLYHHAGTKYSLWAYVIMPNHVHVVLQPDEVWMKKFAEGDSERSQYEKGVLSAILHSLRSFTAKKANKVLGRTGVFWQGEAYDHCVRDNRELQRVIHYVENNPVQAGLARDPEGWRYSSAYDRVQRGLGSFDRIA